jgi:urea transport system substrate-binding protein
VYLWKMAVEKAKSTDVAAVKTAAKGIEFAAPEGMVTVDGDNQHTFKTVRIGKINAEGLIDEVWATDKPVKPDPYLCTYSWAGALPKPEAGCPVAAPEATTAK